ncbi:hypothetical protein OAB62_04240 [Pseudomonadales bacterium]|nr:hypothetical protein [Pseudomonadales bacterium]
MVRQHQDLKVLVLAVLVQEELPLGQVLLPLEALLLAPQWQLAL